MTVYRDGFRFNGAGKLLFRALAVLLAIFISSHTVFAIERVSRPARIDVYVSTAAGENMPSIESMRRFVLSGVGLGLNGHLVLDRVAAAGFRSLRFMNVSLHNQVTIQDGRIKDIAWSPRLDLHLLESGQRGLLPHIVIGQPGPMGLVERRTDGKIHGPVSWDLYRDYIGELVRYVTEEWGFRKVVWEIGNEMDHPHLAWLEPEHRNRSGGDRKHEADHYSQYLMLYSEISAILDEAERGSPDLEFLVGGPALGQYQMKHRPLPDPRNWYLRFLKDVKSRGLRCDFISMHYYGSHASGDEFRAQVADLYAVMRDIGLSLPVRITEWGVSGAGEAAKFNLNGRPMAGAYLLRFADLAADLGIKDGVFLTARNDLDKYAAGPMLFDINNRPQHAFLALKELLDVHPQRLRHEVNTDAVGCISSGDGYALDVLLMNLDSNRHPLYKNLGSLASAAPDSVNLVLHDVPSGMTPVLQGVKINGQTRDLSDFAVRCRDESCEMTITDLKLGDYVYLNFKYEGAGL